MHVIIKKNKKVDSYTSDILYKYVLGPQYQKLLQYGWHEGYETQEQRIKRDLHIYAKDFIDYVFLDKKNCPYNANQLVEDFWNRTQY